MPKVSVIIPVYDTEAFVEESIRSVMGQTLSDIEIVCVDDGSRDGSLAILERLAADDSRIQIVSQANQGLSGARNSGLALARGEYVLFLDSDDLLVGFALEHLYDHAKQHQLDDLVFGSAPFFDPPDLVHEFKHLNRVFDYRANYPSVQTGRNLLTSIVKAGEYFPSACVHFMRRSFLSSHDIRFLVGIIHEDDLFTLQVWNAAQNAGVWPETLHQYRIRYGSIITQRNYWRSILGCFVNLIEIDRMIVSSDDGFQATLRVLRRNMEGLIARSYRSLPPGQALEQADIDRIEPGIDVADVLALSARFLADTGLGGKTMTRLSWGTISFDVVPSRIKRALIMLVLDARTAIREIRRRL